MITGKILRDAIISGAHSISNQKSAVDELNVFPVPDGDTGTNMSMTISNALPELNNMNDDVTCSVVAQTAATALLRGARGNSGVILSLIFRGFAKSFANHNKIGSKEIVSALENGVEGAYKSVMNPTEGTILTVARESAEKARAALADNPDPAELWRVVCQQAEETLEKTPELLPALAKAGVVDSGGKGLVIIFEAMRDVFLGGKIVPQETKTQVSQPTVQDFSSVVGQYDAEINFTYCTEMIINKKADCADSSKLRAYLETIGDCVVVVEDDSIIKVHVHTNDPGKAIQKALKFGYINLPKIENMKLQHQNKKKEAKREFKSVKPEKPFGFVAVAAGKGVQAMFKDCGVDCIVGGGQTMNPSTEDILEAVMQCPAENVFVLPNNKNIIMAAEQAAKLADRNVCVLQTRTIPQGMSAMLAFDPDRDFNNNRLAMTEAIDNVTTGQVTFAARDSDVDDKAIKKGEILCMAEGRIVFVEKDLSKAAYKLSKHIIKGSNSFVNIIYGADVSEESAEALRDQVANKFNHVDVNLINGGQPVYYYIISAE
ncbi:MAG: DAK2 domain-containing protein [Oscillospiraceae bacterium]